MEILYYSDSRGYQDVYDWMKETQKKDPATFNKMYQIQEMLRENGKLIHSGEIKRKDIKKLKGTDIWQIRINDNRVLFFYYASDAIVLTNQFKKKKDDTPQNEIDRAENRKKDWLKHN